MDKKELLKQHPIYTATREAMGSYMDAYLASDNFKRTTRIKRPSEDVKIYEDLIKNTSLMPIARYVVDRINDTIFETGQTRNIQFVNSSGSLVGTPDWAKLFMMDTDFSNNDMTATMANASVMASVFGHCWLMVDKPTMDSRPYVNVISPLSVWDWEFENYNGKNFLCEFKVLESESDDELCFVIYKLGDNLIGTPTRWERWEVSKKDDKKPPELLNYGELPPGMSIPAVQLFARKDPRIADIGISDIDSSVDAMREIYQYETEAYSSINFSKSILRVSPSIKTVPAFAGGVVRGVAGDIESISIDVTDVAIIRAQQDAILKNLTDLTGLSGLSVNSNQVASGLSIIESRKTIHNIAKTKSRFLETAEEMVLTFAAKFMGLNFAGEVRYNTNYSGLDTTYRLALFEKAKQLAPDDAEIQAMITAELKTMLALEEPEASLSDTSYADIPEIITEPADIAEIEQERAEDAEHQAELEAEMAKNMEREGSESDSGSATISNPGIQDVGRTYSSTASAVQRQVAAMANR